MARVLQDPAEPDAILGDFSSPDPLIAMLTVGTIDSSRRFHPAAGGLR